MSESLADRVKRVKASVQGKEYSKLTREEWETLFADDANSIFTVCLHNKIINDSGAIVNETGTQHVPKFVAPKPVPKPEPKADPK